MGSSFHCPLDIQPFMAIHKRWIRGKRGKVSTISGQFGPRKSWKGQRLTRRGVVAKTWPRSPRKGPNCTTFCQFTSPLCPGYTRAITVAGTIMGAIIPVINTPPTVGGRACPAPSMGFFASGFTTLQEASQLFTEL